MKIQLGKIPDGLDDSSLNYLEWQKSKWKIDRQMNLYKEWNKEIISLKYEKIAELKFHDSWIDFAKEFKDYKVDYNRTFRGHSNRGTQTKLEFWEIRSSLNRIYPTIDSEDFLQQVRNGIRNIDRYSYFEKFQALPEIKDLDVFSFLQHHGYNTPLVDFTNDPLTALFFAVSGIPYEVPIGSDNRFLSVFEMNWEILIQHFNFIKIDNDLTPRLFANIDSTTKMNPLAEFQDYYFAQGIKTCIIPQKKLSRELNPNFINQDGAFLYLDIPRDVYEYPETIIKLESLKKIQSLEDILQVIAENKNIIQKAITLHLIPYESVFMCGDKNVFHGPDVILLFLTLRKKTGYDLFSDIQGFRYDFLFSNIKQHSSLDSLLITEDSPEKRFLMDNGLI